MKEHKCPECKINTWICSNNGEDYFNCDCLSLCSSCYKQDYFDRSQRLEDRGIDFDSLEYDERMNINYL